MEKKVSGKSFSKYALSNITIMLKFDEMLKLRLVSKKFDEAVKIGLNLAIFDLQFKAEQYDFCLKNNFDSET